MNDAHLPLQTELENDGIHPTLIINAASHSAILQEAAKLASPAARITARQS